MSKFAQMKRFLEENADERPELIARGNCMTGKICGYEFSLFRDSKYDWCAIYGQDNTWTVFYSTKQLRKWLEGK